MKAVILSGGFGARISEETHKKPKPMIELCGRPILWHIMKIYSYAGINEFIICCGYKGNLIKEYFANYSLLSSDITYDMSKDEIQVHKKNTEKWKVTVVDTGEKTMTGGRIKRIKDYIKNEDIFCLTYGDGVSDVNIPKLIEFHKSHNKLATLTAVLSPSRFGVAKINDKDVVTSFSEKPLEKNSFINGGFFVFSPKIIDYIKNDESVLEKEIINTLIEENQLSAFKHNGFWYPMDTLRDKLYLENLIETNNAPWIKWV